MYKYMLVYRYFDNYLPLLMLLQESVEFLRLQNNF